MRIDRAHQLRGVPGADSECERRPAGLPGSPRGTHVGLDRPRKRVEEEAQAADDVTSVPCQGLGVQFGECIQVWSAVVEGFLVMETKDSQRAFPLRLVGGQRVQVLAAVALRLDDDHAVGAGGRPMGGGAALNAQFEGPFGPVGPPTMFTVPVLRFLKETGQTTEHLAALKAEEQS